MFAAAPFSKPSERPDTNTGVKVEEIHTATNVRDNGMDSMMSGCLH